MRRTTKVFFSYISVNQLCIDISDVLRTYHKRVLEYVKYIHSSGWYVDHILCLSLYLFRIIHKKFTKNDEYNGNDVFRGAPGRAIIGISLLSEAAAAFSLDFVQ